MHAALVLFNFLCAAEENLAVWGHSYSQNLQLLKKKRMNYFSILYAMKKHYDLFLGVI